MRSQMLSAISGVKSLGLPIGLGCSAFPALAFVVVLAMPDLYDLKIEHFDAELGVNDCDFWESLTYEEAQAHIGWHAANTKLVSVELERVGEGEPSEVGEIVAVINGEPGKFMQGVIFSDPGPRRVERTGPMPSPKGGGFTAFSGAFDGAVSDGETIKVVLQNRDAPD